MVNDWNEIFLEWILMNNIFVIENGVKVIKIIFMDVWDL